MKKSSFTSKEQAEITKAAQTALATPGEHDFWAAVSAELDRREAIGKRPDLVEPRKVKS